VNSIINCKFLLGKHKRYGCLRYSSELIAGDECIYDASSKIWLKDWITQLNGIVSLIRDIYSIPYFEQKATTRNRDVSLK